MSSTPDPKTEIQITNSTQSPVIIMLPTTSTTPDPGATMVYGQELEVLTAVDGNTQIATNKTETFSLNQTYLDPDTNKSKYSTIYDLVPCSPDSYFPLDSLGVVQNPTGPPWYDQQTVTSDSAAAFQNAGKFIQAISAYPTSDLATGYQKALSQAQTNASQSADGSPDSGGAVTKSISDTVADYFKQHTISYQNVTLDAIVNVQAYYSSFPFVWSEHATDTTTYYLYYNDGTKTSFAGTIALTPPRPADFSMVNAGFTCTFTPAADGSDTTNVNVDKSGDKPLTYLNGQFVDDVKEDLPLVAVRGTFQVKSIFTGKPSDIQAIPVLTGTVNHVTCVGFDSPQLSNDPDSAFWDTLFNPKTKHDWLTTFLTLGGVVMMLAFFGGMIWTVAKWGWAAYKGNKPVTNEDLQQQLRDAAKSNKEFTETLIKQMSDGKLSAPSDVAAASRTAGEQWDMLINYQNAVRLQNGLSAQERSLKSLAESMRDMTDAQIRTMEGLGGEIRDSVNALAQADPANLDAVIKAQATNLKSITTRVTNFKTEVSGAISQSQKAAIDRNIEVAKTAAEEVEDMEKVKEESLFEDDPELEAIEDIKV